MKSQPKLTPMMQQWHQAKLSHEDAILLFRMGDFYELFGDDAVKAAPILELTLTCRDKDKAGMKMAGFPFHAADNYIDRLVEHGFKVAICEQLEDPKLSKGIVKRGITNVITPGTTLGNESGEYTSPSYLVGLFCKNDELSLSVLDVQSGQFLVTKTKNLEDLKNETLRFAPKEIIIAHRDEVCFRLAQDVSECLKQSFCVRIEKREPQLSDDKSFSLLSEVENTASTLVLRYLRELKGTIFSHIGLPRQYAMASQLLMDEATRINLDLLPIKKGHRHNLFFVVNHTKTIMGRRALFAAIKAPSTAKDVIEERQNLVELFVNDDQLRKKLRDILGQFYDLERLVALASANKISPRGLAHIRECIKNALFARTLLLNTNNAIMKRIFSALSDQKDLFNALDAALITEPPLNIKDGGVFRRGFDDKLDVTMELINNGKDMIIALEARERDETKIPSLKIKFTRVFGYYLEITKTHLKKVPPHYQRKQTIANGERYVTPELMELEERLQNAQEDALRIEEERFSELRSMVVKRAKDLLELARSVAHFDVMASLAEISRARSWSKPQILEAKDRFVDIKGARHPLLEEMCLENGTYFVPNDVRMDCENQSMLLITGPNMAGKSTIMRSVALTQILAQMGSFVPAMSAKLSICDAIFARVGASDDPASGRSTFMVEMTETAAILNNATDHSLIILDEIGRGTSTYDGMSIAQAVAEYIHDELATRTLFATHYHELTKLEAKLKRLKNIHVGVMESNDGIRFLYCLRDGPCLKSFGIEVARLSGIPPKVLDRAVDILRGLEEKPNLANQEERQFSYLPQLDLFGTRAANSSTLSVVDLLIGTDVNRLTPLQALNKLASWQLTLRKHLKDEG